MTANCDRLPILPQLRTRQPCIVDAPIKKRNGQPYYWCHTHGKELQVPPDVEPPDECAGADVEPVEEEEVFELDLATCSGGAAAWGATGPVVSWGVYVPENGGVHVHARHERDGEKFIDQSVTILRLISGEHRVDLDEESARAFMVSSIAGRENVVLQCPRCGWPHLDRDVFAVGPHRKHVCNRCGRSFWAADLTISNPAMAIRDLPGVGTPPAPLPVTGSIELSRTDGGGFAVWGSNPAVFWTFHRPEAEGIHVHVWNEDGDQIEDETFGAVSLEGHRLDPQQVRLLMAQRQLFGRSRRLDGLTCPHCGAPHADLDADAFVPSNTKHCGSCRHDFQTPRRRLMVSNPLITLLRELGFE